MKNFGRVVRLAMRHRWSFVGSVICAIAVGLLWGANIGTVYPFVEVAFKGDSLHDWVDAKVEESHTANVEAADDYRQLTRELDSAKESERESLQYQQEIALARYRAEKKAESRYQAIQPYVVGYLPDDPFKTLAVLIGVLLVGTLIKDLFLISNAILVARLSQSGTFELRKLFYARTLNMDTATFANEGTADLLSRFTYDMNGVADGLNSLFGKLVREPLKMAACFIGAACICWRLLILSLIIAPIAGLAIRWLAKMLKRANRRAMEEMSQLFATLEEAFRGIKVVKSFTMEPREKERFGVRNSAFYKQSMRIARYDSLSHPMTEILGIMMICMALLAGAYMVINGQTHLFGIRMSTRPLDLGSLLLFYALLAGAADPARKLSDIFTKLQKAAAASDRIYAMVDREPEVRDPVNPKPLGQHHQDLVFDGVSFAYNEDRNVLHDLSLTISYGETVAIVGSSGCGKSTLVNLIPRFADPDQGTLRLDGLALTDVKIRDLRSQIGLVTQEPVLFDETVLNNIRYGSPDATREEVIEAAMQAHAHNFIETDLSHGYDTVIGPMGGQLSGGQRQRIALARAILRDPSILILDEATSQVDLHSEQIINEVLEKFVRDRTTIIITHRLGILSLADRIVVMEEGRIKSTGTHEELLTTCDFYRGLFQMQKSA